MLSSRKDLSFRVYVLNLARRTDRLVEFSASLRRHEAWLWPHVCRVKGTDGRNRSEIQWLAENGLLVNRNVERLNGLTAGMIGCYASHWQVLKMIADDTSIDFGVVAEDDLIHYASDFETQFARLWNNTDGGASSFWKHAEWVVLQQDGAGWRKGGTRESRPTLLRRRTRQEWPKNTALYAVRRDTAQRLTSSSRRREAGGGPMMPIRDEFDVVLPLHLRDMWMFEPPIAQAMHMFEAGGSSDTHSPKGVAKRWKGSAHDIVNRTFALLESVQDCYASRAARWS
eukprot:TRINITY_DN46657_c0_g1_i1.p1 TRINITY_DN46657_c0_g1~~TRINITY_DN46657_c0_g1_i1.p1  ORF type:complete len:284 (+),score=17.57 TRINITY_DN46657_c0_g1_i1:228-1079(+)